MAPDRTDLVSLVAEPSTFLTHDDPILRRMAVTALEPHEAADRLEALTQLAKDANAEIRAAVAEKLGSAGPVALPTLDALAADSESVVREACATAYGEIADPAALTWLIEVSAADDDRAVREAAVASLGAIGDASAVDHLLGLLRDGPPPVRRRTVAALTVFDDERIEPAIRRAAFDRNPGVREAAEMVVGRQLEA